MKCPTKKVRNVIYKEALKLYLQDVNTVNYPSGLCHYIITVIYAKRYNFRKWYSNRTTSNLFYLFPEIDKHRPLRLCIFWFPLDDTKTRIQILEQAIKETES